MDFLRYSKNVFGQKVLAGVNWDLLWVPVFLAIAVILIHLSFRFMTRK
jgi:hypothetical protein